MDPTDVSPVPPLATANVPPRLIVPDDVTGLFVTVIPERLDCKPTLVTVPTEDIVAHEVDDPFVVKYFPEFPVWVGKRAFMAAFAVV